MPISVILDEIIHLASNGRTLEFRATEQRLHITLRGNGVQASYQFPWREAVKDLQSDSRLRHTLEMMYSDWKRAKSRKGAKEV